MDVCLEHREKKQTSRGKRQTQGFKTFVPRLIGYFGNDRRGLGRAHCDASRAPDGVCSVLGRCSLGMREITAFGAFLILKRASHVYFGFRGVKHVSCVFEPLLPWDGGDHRFWRMPCPKTYLMMRMPSVTREPRPQVRSSPSACTLDTLLVRNRSQNAAFERVWEPDVSFLFSPPALHIPL